MSRALDSHNRTKYSPGLGLAVIDAKINWNIPDPDLNIGKKVGATYIKDEILFDVLYAICLDSTTPSCDWELRFGTDPTATGTLIVGATTTATTAVQTITSFTTPRIPGGNVIWLEIDAATGTWGSLDLTEYHG